MIDELVKTVRLHLSERLTSPLMGAFVVSWCLWNYKMILVLLSEEPVLEKFRILKEVVYPDWQHMLGPGLLLPLVMCLAYLFLYPYPAKRVYAYTRQKQREILEIRRKIEEETPLTIEDSRRLKGELARAREEMFLEADRKDAEIARLKAQISALQDEASRTEVTLRAEPASEKELTDEQLVEIANLKRIAAQDSNLSSLLTNVLKEVGAYRYPVSTFQIQNGFDEGDMPIDHVAIEYALGELERRGLIEVLINDEGNRSFQLTHEGRGAVIRAREAETA